MGTNDAARGSIFVRQTPNVSPSEKGLELQYCCHTEEEEKKDSAMLHAEGSSGWISGPVGQDVERPELSRDVVLGSWSDEAVRVGC
jgi:hypothetical protein